MLWKAVPLNSKDWDVSDQLNNKLAAASGNAVINLTVHATGSNFLDWYFASLVPLIPSYVTVSVEGDIAKVANTP